MPPGRITVTSNGGLPVLSGEVVARDSACRLRSAAEYRAATMGTPREVLDPSAGVGRRRLTRHSRTAVFRSDVVLNTESPYDQSAVLPSTRSALQTVTPVPCHGGFIHISSTSEAIRNPSSMRRYAHFLPGRRSPPIASGADP